MHKVTQLRTRLERIGEAAALVERLPDGLEGKAVSAHDFGAVKINAPAVARALRSMALETMEELEAAEREAVPRPFYGGSRAHV